MSTEPISFSQTQSRALIERAQKSIPGGVNSPVRAFTGVGGTPVFFDTGKGSRLIDVDGNSYIDYVGSWGPMILGHSPAHVIDAVVTQAQKALGLPSLRLNSLNWSANAYQASMRCASSARVQKQLCRRFVSPVAPLAGISS